MLVAIGGAVVSMVVGWWWDGLVACEGVTKGGGRNHHCLDRVSLAVLLVHQESARMLRKKTRILLVARQLLS